MSIETSIDRKDVVYTYNGILLSHKKNEIMLFAAIWMDLENIVGEGDGTPLQYSCLENPMDGGAWLAAVHGVAKSQTRLSDFTFTFHFHALEKEMATHSSVLAWRIPGTVEPDGLPSMGSHRVRHDWSDLAAAENIVLSEVRQIKNILWYHLYVEYDTIKLIYKTETDS